MSTQVIDAMKENKDYIIQTLQRVICTPIVASACSNMFPVFIESVVIFLPIFEMDFKTEFMLGNLNNINLQISNMLLLIQTDSFDNVSDIEACVKSRTDIKFDEIETSEQRLSLITQLKDTDQASVIFGKISFYCDFLQKCSPAIKLKIIKHESFSSTMT